MSRKKKAQSSELTGGSGFVYEGYVAAHFLAALLTEEVRSPFNTKVKSVRLQQSAYGAPLDDVIVEFDDRYSSKLHLQVKRSLTISAAKTNKDFREVINKSWLTYMDPANDHEHDHYGAATDDIASASLRGFRKVTQAAQDSHNETVFFSRNNASDTASKEFDKIIKDIRKILTEANIEFSEAEFHGFLKNLVILEFDVMTLESIANSETINRLASLLGSSERAMNLWAHLKNIARESSGTSATFDQNSLKRKLYPHFQFNGFHSSIESTKDNNDRLGLDASTQVSPRSCSIAVSHCVSEDKDINLTAIVVTDDAGALAKEVGGLKDKLKRSTLIDENDRKLIESKSLKELVKIYSFSNEILNELLTTDISIYIYYGRAAEVSDWLPEKFAEELMTTPILHRLSNKSEIAEVVYSKIDNIEMFVAAAAKGVMEKYRRVVSPSIADKRSKNTKNILELSDLISEICTNYLSSRPIFPVEYIRNIRTRIRYGENVGTGEKHLRDKNNFA